jgi:hypothetical protein
MIKKKRAFFIVAGIISQVVPLTLLLLVPFNCDCKNSVGATLAVAVLSLLFFALYNGFLSLLTMPFRDNGKTSFVHFFMKPINMKIVSHEHLGDFFINLGNDDNYITIYKQKLFILEDIGNVRKSNNIEKMAGDIKKFLDDKYQKILNEKNKEEAILAWKKRVADWDGYLDPVTRRDNKINELLKK